MIPVLAIARQSAWNRRATLSLVAVSIGLSTVLLLGFARMRADVRESFSQSVRGTDLIVGARTGSVQLLLYAVFRVGGATNHVRMASFEEVAKNPAVAWMVPLSLGDSHRGFPVLATPTDYFARFLYGDRQLRDADPRAEDMLRRVRDLWSSAPTNPAMEGAVVRIPGYVVPLEQDKRGLREFLLVPYFGACIHTPPPPANQIIDVKARVPLASVHSMDMVWVSGTLKTSRTETSMGASSYALEADAVDPYQAPPR